MKRSWVLLLAGFGSWGCSSAEDSGLNQVQAIDAGSDSGQGGSTQSGTRDASADDSSAVEENGWVAQPSGTTASLNGVAYGADRFVAVGEGFAMTSLDGKTWSPAHPVPYPSLKFVEYGNSQFVAGGGYGLLVSDDGVKWRLVGPYMGTSQDTFTGAAYGDGRWVVTTSSPDSYYVRKGNLDDITSKWELRKRVGSSFMIVSALSFGGGQFMSLATDLKGMRFAGPSIDGLLWSWFAFPKEDTPGEALVWGSNTWISVGSKGEIYSSTLGTEWTYRKARSVTERLTDVSYGPLGFVAVGARQGLRPFAMQSADGELWKELPVKCPELTSLLLSTAYGGGVRVAVGSAGCVLTRAE